MNNLKKLSKTEKGMAAFIVVGVLMTVATLIIIGFATMTRREQRQALDQQLSAQARYAAEAAINQKIAEFRSDPSAILAGSNNCSDKGQTFSGATEIQTTCVRINTAPGPLDFDEVTSEDSLVTWLDPGTDIVDKIVITWQLPKSSATGGDCRSGGYGTLPGTLPANDIGMIRFDLTSVNEANFSRNSLKWGTLSGLLMPKSSSPNTSSYSWTPNVSWNSPSTPPTGPVVFGACTDPAVNAPSGEEMYKAYAEIDVPNTGSQYLLRLRGVYKTNRIRVIGYDVAGDVVLFTGSQVAIEATARVNDIVQRVQVRIPAGSPPANVLPDEALNVSNGVCKLLQTEPNSTTSGC